MGSLNLWFREIEKGNVKPGCTKANAECVGNINEILAMNARNCAMLYFCIKTLKIDGLNAMYASTMKQKSFYVTAKGFLKHYKLEDKWISNAKSDIAKMYNRQNHIWLITRENIRLTEYYPFFMEIGFEKLLDFDLATMDVLDQLKYIADEFETWKSNNKDKIDSHMESVAVEKKALEDIRKKRDEDKKREKEERRLAKKAADDEVKEIRENNKKHMARYKKLEKSFERHYRGGI